MALKYALGPELGPVIATRGFAPQPPAVDSPGGAAALSLPDVTASLTGAYEAAGTLAVGVVCKVHAHARAGFARIVGLAAVFAPEGTPLPADADALMAAGLPRGEVGVSLEPGPDGVVPEHSASIEVPGLAEGRNDGRVVIAFDDSGYPDDPDAPPASDPEGEAPAAAAA